MESSDKKDSTKDEYEPADTTVDSKPQGQTEPFQPSDKTKNSTKDEDVAADIKIFNDSVHGTIRLHPLLVTIIDTPEFQRLRNIKQLGAAYRVYPAASHNRFEHSIGVCHLAGEFIEKLWRKQPRVVKIDKKDVLCVKIAGLCHDIGHGPFSHLFDKEFQELCVTENKTAKWKHEEMSRKILKKIFDTNTKVQDALVEYGLEDKHKELIYDLIDHEGKTIPDDEAFLYQIVADDNGLDVDRWDYFARDCLHLGLKQPFDHLRCMEMARVIDGKICYREKEAVNIYNMFYTRFNLYRCAYYHPVSSAVQLMIAEAFWLAKDSLKFPGKDGKGKHLHEIFEDEVAYGRATDSIYETILHWHDAQPGSDMEKAQKLLLRIEERDFYQLVCDIKAPKAITDKSVKERLIKGIQEWLEVDFKTKNLLIKVIDVGFGGSGEYPLQFVQFFKKEKNPESSHTIKREDLPSPIASMESHDYRIRIFSKLSHDKGKKFIAEKGSDFTAKLQKKIEEIQNKQAKVAAQPDVGNVAPQT